MGVIQRGLVRRYQRFAKTYCFHNQGCPEERGGMFLQNVEIYLQVDSVTTQKTNIGILTADEKLISYSVYIGGKECTNYIVSENNKLCSNTQIRGPLAYKVRIPFNSLLFYYEVLVYFDKSQWSSSV